MTEQYEKKELRQHIYDTPDTYVGGIDKISEVLPIKDSDKIVFKEIEYIPALLNIFNEILVNARDQIVRLQGQKGANIVQVSHIKIDYNDDSFLLIESIPSRETRLFVERVLTNIIVYELLNNQSENYAKQLVETNTIILNYDK